MDEQLDISQLKAAFKRRKWTFVIPMLMIAVSTIAVALILPNLYQSSATILIENQQIPSAIVPSMVTSYAEQRIQSITQEVMSRSKILNLIEKYDLFPDKRAEWPTEILVDKVRNRIVIESVDAEINTEKQNRAVIITIAFLLLFADERPKVAQAVANEVASYYLEKNLESRRKNARGTTIFLEEQLEKNKVAVSELEAKIAQFRKKHMGKLPDFMILNMQKLEKINGDITNINMQIRSNKEQVIAIENKISAIDPHSSSSVITPKERLQQIELLRVQFLARYSGKHPQLVALDKEAALLEPLAYKVREDVSIRERLQHLEIKLVDLKSRYSDRHPSVVDVKQEIDRLNEMLTLQHEEEKSATEKNMEETATNPVYVTLKTDLDKLAISISSLEEEKERFESQSRDTYEKLLAMPEVAKKYNEFDMDYQSAKAHYYEIMQKLLAARVSQGMEDEQMGENFKVVEPAFLPEKPYKPNRLAIILIGGVMGIGAGVGLASLKEFADRTVLDSALMEKISGLHVLAVISTMQTEEQIRKLKRRKIIFAVSIVMTVSMILILFHFFVMDFYVFNAKLQRFIKSRFIL